VLEPRAQPPLGGHLRAGERADRLGVRPVDDDERLDVRRLAQQARRDRGGRVGAHRERGTGDRPGRRRHRLGADDRHLDEARQWSGHGSSSAPTLAG